MQLTLSGVVVGLKHPHPLPARMKGRLIIIGFDLALQVAA